MAGTLKDLIVVPAHGVWRRGRTRPDVASRDDSWLPGRPREAALLLAHIAYGVGLAASRGNALLVFSGGETEAGAPDRAESDSYYEVAVDHDWWSHREVLNRTERERFARDSCENLLFALACFVRRTQYWPTRIALVGWRFKASRFELHWRGMNSQALFEYHGINDPPTPALDQALDGERQKLQATRADPLLIGNAWVAQRRRRNPFRRRHPYRGIDPKLDVLLVGHT